MRSRVMCDRSVLLRACFKRVGVDAVSLTWADTRHPARIVDLETFFRIIDNRWDAALRDVEDTQVRLRAAYLASMCRAAVTFDWC